MTKKLIARKCKDNWLVEITETHEVKTREEVLAMARYENLKVQNYGDMEKVVGV